SSTGPGKIRRLLAVFHHALMIYKVKAVNDSTTGTNHLLACALIFNTKIKNLSIMPNTSTTTKKKKTSERGNQLEKFFMDAVRDLYWAEKNLTKALPKMQKAATSPELQSAIEEHIAQTEEHVARLEEVFKL